MNPTKLATTYLNAFFGETPLEDIRDILSDDLQFTGPFYKYETADDYLASLKETLPEGVVNYEILKEIEKGNTCCIVYKPEQDQEISAQLFEVVDNKITRIRFLADASRLLNS